MILVLKMTDTLYWCLHLSIKHQQTSVNLKWYGVNLEAGTTRWDGSGNKNLCTIQPCCGIFQHGDSCHTALVNLYSNLLILWRDLLHWWHTGITTVLNHGACQLPFEYASLPMEIFSGDCCTALQCFMNYFLLAQPFHSTQTNKMRTGRMQQACVCVVVWEAGLPTGTSRLRSSTQCMLRCRYT